MSTFRHNGYLIHYNHNHDALGRFARSSGGVSTSTSRKIAKAKEKATKKYENSDREFVARYAHTYAKERTKLRNIRKTDSDVTELAANKVAQEYVHKGSKAATKYLNKYYNNYDPSYVNDNIKMGKYYTDMHIAQLGIERANLINTKQGRKQLVETYTMPDPLAPGKTIPNAHSYKTNRDIRKEQKNRKRK